MTSSLAAVFIALVCVTSSRGEVTCPEECRCGVVSGAPSADCSGRQITDLVSVLRQLHPDTQVLDLRFNELTSIHADAFSGVRNLSVILLDDNHIHDVQPHAFRGVGAVRLVSLTGNRITTVTANSFSRLVAPSHICSTSVGDGEEEQSASYPSRGPCVIDLSRNDVRSVEKYAFAWTKYLDVVLGDGRLPLSVDAYAFYGARGMRRVVFQNVPSLTLRPRFFTNTESVDRVEIRQTLMTTLDTFVFEGLKGVAEIVLDRVDVGNIRSFAFSGIQFRRQRGLELDSLKSGGRNAVQWNGGEATPASSGGSINVTSCQVGVLSTDAFRDANLERISISRTDVDRLEKHAFRGVSGLQSLCFDSCRLGSTIGAERFSSLRGLSRLHLNGLIDTRVVDRFAFRGTTNIDQVLIHFRSDHVTLRTEAFAHVSDVGTLELRGNADQQSSANELTIDVGAFRNLVGVQRMRLADFRLPTLRRHSFSGMSRVGNLTISDCSVSGIEREAFGDVASHVGAIGLLDLGAGNQLRCDCGTTSGGAVALQRELAKRFSRYHAMCRVASGGHVSYVNVRQMANDVCSGGSSQRTFPSISRVLSVVVAVAFFVLSTYS